MQVNETLSEGLKHEFQISVPAADLESKVDERLLDMKDKVKLNGFRPGKVPVGHLKRIYGRSVMAETIDQVPNAASSSRLSRRSPCRPSRPRSRSC